MNLQFKGTLPCDTLPNQKNYCHCMEIITRSGKKPDSMGDTTKEIVIEKKSGENPKIGVNPISPMLNVDENILVEEESPNLEEEKVNARPHVVIISEGVKEDIIVKGLMPKCPHPYPQRMIKKKEGN